MLEPNKPLDDPYSHKPICLVYGIGKFTNGSPTIPLFPSERGRVVSQIGNSTSQCRLVSFSYVGISRTSAPLPQWVFLFGFRLMRSAINLISAVTKMGQAEWSPWILRDSYTGIGVEFFLERLLYFYYNSDDEPKMYGTICEFPHGSVLGPPPTLQLPAWLTVVGFPDDIGVITMVGNQIDAGLVLVGQLRYFRSPNAKRTHK